MRLKRPRGYANPGGFDYHVWLLQKGVDATGYVRKDPANQVLLDEGGGHSIDKLRAKIKARMAQLLSDERFAGVITALVIGDKRGISEAQWQVFSKTGTNHLVVISGLHIGLVAAMAYWLAVRLVSWWCWPLRFFPASSYAAIAALLCSFGYSALAGFSLPTVRALIMVATIMLARVLRFDWPLASSLCIALFGVLLWDPLAVFSSGFWLSFGAVAVLLYGMSSRLSNRGLWWIWGRPQWVVFLGLTPLLVVFFQQVSHLSPLANIIAIPVVSVIIVPLCLLGATLLAVNGAASQAVLLLAHKFLEGLWYFLNSLIGVFGEYALWQPSGWHMGAILAAAIAAVLLLAPRGTPARYLSLLFFCVLVFPKNPGLQVGDVDVSVLDVGQGLSVVVRTTEHVLVYDTGTKFDSGFDMGKAVLVPFLKQRGIQSVDRVIVSHDDNDHSGGLHSLINNIVVGDLLIGESLSAPTRFLPLKCTQGLAWDWDGVRFQILHPKREFEKKANNRSCVLLIEAAGGRLLLSGDIERSAEQRLVEEYGPLLRADILVAPHHGSRSSSSDDFVRLVDPQYTVFSAGYRNHFHHPHPSIVERYRQRDITLLNTAYAGALDFSLRKGKEIEVSRYRDKQRRYWYQEPTDKVSL